MYPDFILFTCIPILFFLHFSNGLILFIFVDPLIGVIQPISIELVVEVASGGYGKYPTQL